MPGAYGQAIFTCLGLSSGIRRSAQEICNPHTEPYIVTSKATVLVIYTSMLRNGLPCAPTACWIYKASLDAIESRDVGCGKWVAIRSKNGNGVSFRQAMIDKFDPDGDSEINEAEFVAMMTDDS